MKAVFSKNIQTYELVSNQTPIYDSKFLISFTSGLNKRDFSSLQKFYSKNALLLNSGVILSKSGQNVSNLIKKLNDFFLASRFIILSKLMYKIRN